MRQFTLLWLLLILTALNCFAQQQIDLNDIKKINLIDAQGGLSFGRTTTFEVVVENGSWLCYQTKQQYDVFSKQQRDYEYFKKENSNERKFVKKIAPSTITSFLQAIAVIKPTYNWKLFGIGPDSLIKTLDTVYLKNGNITPVHHKIFISALSKASNVKAAIDSLQHDNWTDDNPFCGIEIIKKNNDTVKVNTYRQIDYMLPWQVNKVETYDPAINHFFTAVMGNYRYSNKSRLLGMGLPYRIQDFIYSNYAQQLFIIHDWQDSSAASYRLLIKNLNISRLTYDNDGIDMSANSKNLPKNFTINAGIKMGDTQIIKQLIDFKDIIARFVKLNNFALNYYKNRQHYSVTFNYYWNNANNYVSQYIPKYKAWLQQNPSVNEGNIIRMYVEGPHRVYDDWLLLPDNRLILLSYFNPAVAGLNYQSLKIGDDNRKDCFIVFDSKGNILSQN